MTFLRLPVGDGEHIVVNANHIAAMIEVNGTTLVRIAHDGVYVVPMLARDILGPLGSVVFGKQDDTQHGHAGP